MTVAEEVEVRQVEHSRGVSRPNSAWTWLVCSSVMAAACGGGPQVQSTPNFRDDALKGSRVLFVPLAVSDDLGDKRTGIILSERTRAYASAAACAELAESWNDGSVVCLDARKAAEIPALGQLARHFALDEPVPEEVWRNVRDASGASHAVLFRPESVASSRDTGYELKGPLTPLVHGGPMLATSALVAVIVGASTWKQVRVNNTELTYTVSASLVDMRSGKLLRVGVHSGSDSHTTARDRGFAEAPPAAPILEEIMSGLGESVLDD
jgi:hypothetical protein